MTAPQRHHRPSALLAAGLLLAVAASPALAQAPKVVGINAAVLNDVRIRSAGAAQPRPAVVRQKVALADQVRTGQRSQLQLLLLDKSVFTVGANAQLTIDRYVYDPDGGGAFAASVTKGAFRFMSGGTKRAGGSSISTPVATIGIRGTIIDGVIGPEAVAIAMAERVVGQGVRSDPATASLIILRGPGQRAEGKALAGAIDVSAAGRTVALDRPLLAAYVPAPGAPPIGPFTISLPGLARVQALIFPTLAERMQVARPTGPLPAYPAPPLERDRQPLDAGYLPDFNGNAGPAIPSYGTSLPDIPRPDRPSGMTGQTPTARPTATPASPTTRGQATSTPTPTPVPTTSAPPVMQPSPAAPIRTTAPPGGGQTMTQQPPATSSPNAPPPLR